MQANFHLLANTRRCVWGEGELFPSGNSCLLALQASLTCIIENFVHQPPLSGCLMISLLTLQSFQSSPKLSLRVFYCFYPVTSFFLFCWILCCFCHNFYFSSATIFHKSFSLLASRVFSHFSDSIISFLSQSRFFLHGLSSPLRVLLFISCFLWYCFPFIAYIDKRKKGWAQGGLYWKTNKNTQWFSNFSMNLLRYISVPTHTQCLWFCPFGAEGKRLPLSQWPEGVSLWV